MDVGARGAPLELGPLDLVFGEAALAADSIMASFFEIFGLGTAPTFKFDVVNDS